MNSFRQRGATLITALVMLVVLTLLVISAINSSTVNLRIAGNMQIHEEVVAAAQQATEQVLSYNFAANPSLAVNNANTAVIGAVTYAVAASAVCTGNRPLYNNEPNLPQQCVSASTANNTGIIFDAGFQNTSTSWCSAQQWDVRAAATDSRTGANAVTHQGVSMIVPTGTTCTVTVPQS